MAFTTYDERRELYPIAGGGCAGQNDAHPIYYKTSRGLGENSIPVEVVNLRFMGM